MISEKWHNSANELTYEYTYVYDGEGNIVKTIDKTLLKEYNYLYDDGNLVRAVEYDVTIANDIVTSRTRVVSIVYVYDDLGELLKKRVIYADGTESYITPTRDTADNVDSSQFYSNVLGVASFNTSTATDGLGRRTTDSVKGLTRSFTYHDGEVTAEHTARNKVNGEATTQLVDTITYSDGRTIAYEYDNEERITKVTDSLDGTTEYTYDALGQLLTETKNGDVINSMTYDGYGNILTKNGNTYGYIDAAWDDLLTHYNHQAITYDAQGNPTAYRGKSLVWEKGRQLKSYDGITYTYNANGIRTSKIVDDVTHTYILDGTKVLKETWGTNTLVPLYDNEDSVCGISYNGTSYYFVKNLQGDIIAIADASNAVIARYSYDAWGMCTVVSDSTSVSIATVNPYRYRGYYYDVETGLYYLQSRYYDPEVGRFINGDDRLLPCFCLATNLYSYTLNSPIIHADYMGHDAVLLIESGGAGYMGHAALLIKVPAGLWYYFSVSTKRDGGVMVIDFLHLGYKLDITDIDSANRAINRAAKNSKNIYGITLAKKGVYTEMYYFYGNFMKSYSWCKKLYNNPAKYSLLTNNCLQNAAYALSLGTCEGYYAKEYEKAIFYLGSMTIPNSANNAMYHFETSISTYYHLPWYIKLFTRDPFYYFTNSMYLS